jgi:phosphoribosyl-dephospho-CoA transferase
MRNTGISVMNTQSFYTRQMLLRYSRQLVSARKLARYEQLLGQGSQHGSEAAAVKRSATIERVAREIMENLIFSGSDNPVVQEVQARLAEESGKNYIFRYPPAEQDFQIYQVASNGEETELTQGEKQMVMGQLWNVALRTVDATML